MTESSDQDRIDSRAELLPEELEAGSDDPEAQAKAILEGSGDRTDHPEESRRESSQTPDGQTPDGQTPDGQTPDGQTPDGQNPNEPT